MTSELIHIVVLTRGPDCQILAKHVGIEDGVGGSDQRPGNTGLKPGNTAHKPALKKRTDIRTLECKRGFTESLRHFHILSFEYGDSDERNVESEADDAIGNLLCDTVPAFFCVFLLSSLPKI